MRSKAPNTSDPHSESKDLLSLRRGARPRPFRFGHLVLVPAGIAVTLAVCSCGRQRSEPQREGSAPQATHRSSSPAPDAEGPRRSEHVDGTGSFAQDGSRQYGEPGGSRDANTQEEITRTPAPESAGNCPASDSSAVGLLVSPEHPYAGGTVSIIAAELAPEPLALRVQEVASNRAHTDERDIDVRTELRMGLPTATIARWTPQQTGMYRAIAGRNGVGLRCRTFAVNARRTTAESSPRPPGRSGLWPERRAWSSGEEALYSAWIREMFHAPVGAELAFARLDEVTSNKERNLLFDHHGWDEDSAKSIGLRLKPDCADTPYFFRAYYAWKRGLPFGFRSCDSGRPGVAPSCGALHAVTPRPEPEGVKNTRLAAGSLAPAASSAAGPSRPDVARWLEGPRPTGVAKDGKRGELAAVQDFFSRTLAWGVHTGNARTAFGDDASDFYPVSLTAHGLRPGSIYADPYGHVLMVVEMVRPTAGRPGVLYAADGQPDGSFTRKRFWEGNFLFNPDPALGGSGFKAFRPVVVREHAGERRLISLKDSEIAKEPGYADVSREQATLSPEAFYDRMERLITPGLRNAALAQEELVRALAEAARVRVTSIDNGQKHFAEHPNAVIDMPTGFKIFEASGPWEDFSTPARDLRLLIAIDVVTHFEQKVARSAESYGVNDPAALDDLKKQLAAERERLLRSPELAFTYTRSDGSKWPLSLFELIERAPALEVGYNPNDCPEARWGAPDGTEERSTCKRHAPDDQVRKLESYRVWFRERRRPLRGAPGAGTP